MRRSCEVPLTLLATIALASVSGCEQKPVEVRNCVDAQNHIVPDKDCRDRPTPTGGGAGGAYRYVYGGASGEHDGDTVVGGESSPEEGATVVSGEEAAARGGFGHGGGESGGEGEGGHGGGGGE